MPTTDSYIAGAQFVVLVVGYCALELAGEPLMEELIHNFPLRLPNLELSPPPYELEYPPDPLIHEGPTLDAGAEYLGGEYTTPLGEADSGLHIFDPLDTGLDLPAFLPAIGNRRPADIAGNTSYRPIQTSVTKSVVEQYAQNMANGTFDWYNMGDRIEIVNANNGQFIVSGHHRILAALLAGVQIPNDPRVIGVTDLDGDWPLDPGWDNVHW